MTHSYCAEDLQKAKSKLGFIHSYDRYGANVHKIQVRYLGLSSGRVYKSMPR